MKQTTHHISMSEVSTVINRAQSLISTCSMTMGVLLLVACISCGEKHEEGQASKQTESADLAGSIGEKNIKKLVGQWLRPDGGYVIQIRNVGPDGTLDAAYLNPRPINVSKAKATVKGNSVQVFIELYDEGYPGSTYTLAYDSQNDAMIGTYFQAAITQTFDVAFIRMK